MAGVGSRPRNWDRFAKWAPGAALIVLAVFIVLLIAAGVTERTSEAWQAANSAPVAEAEVPVLAEGEDAQRDTDLRLYDKIAERVGNGENYYAVAVEEQRARDFPVRPGLAVRLPTLALVTGLLGEWGLIGLALALGGITVFAWWRLLDDEPGGRELRTFVLLLLVIGIVAGFKPQYLALHEVWAGVLIALAIALHRPGKWVATVLVAACALAVREHALPFAMLMGALAFVRGYRAEAIAWGFLILLFATGLAFHLAQVAQYTNASDPASPSWMALRGLGGWTSNIVLSGPLHLLPGWLAAPLVLVPLLGWAGWRSHTGVTGFLLCLGYGVAFMIAGRDNNFYWALVVMPIWFIGLAFLPRAIAGLVNSARGY